VDEFLQSFGAARVLGSTQIVCGILLAFILSLALATVYRWTHQGLSYSRSFVHTQVLGAIVAAILIMAIGNNLARGLGILGTLAIVRFRTPVRDPRDLIFLFASIAVGIAAGAAVFEVAILGTLLFSAAALYLHWSPFAARHQHEGLLRYILPADSPLETKVDDIFQQFASSTLLVAMRQAAQGDAIEYSYQIRLRDPSFQADLLAALHELEGIEDVSLLMQRVTVEI